MRIRVPKMRIRQLARRQVAQLPLAQTVLFEHAMKRTIAIIVGILQASILTVGCDDSSTDEAGETFTYSGDTGPEHWAELPGWEGDHARHSPINITDATSDSELPELDFTSIAISEVDLFNNGHTLEMEWHEGSTIVFGSTTYEVLQFHFHTYSEHQINGAHSDMEMHVVCRQEAGTALLVVAVLFDSGEVANTFLSDFDTDLPAKSTSAHIASATEVDLAGFLAGLETSEYYTYDGSLTTPPASGIVTWVVMDFHATMSDAQFRRFRSVLGNNFRPVQELSGRTIKQNF